MEPPLYAVIMLIIPCKNSASFYLHRFWARNVQSFQALHRIAIGNGSLVSHGSIFLFPCMLCQPTFLWPSTLVHGQDQRCDKILTCSQTAVLLPSPSFALLGGFAALTLRTRPNSSD